MQKMKLTLTEPGRLVDVRQCRFIVADVAQSSGFVLAFALSFLWDGMPGLVLFAMLAIFYLLPTVAGPFKINQKAQ